MSILFYKRMYRAGSLAAAGDLAAEGGREQGAGLVGALAAAGRIEELVGQGANVFTGGQEKSLPNQTFEPAALKDVAGEIVRWG